MLLWGSVSMRKILRRKERFTSLPLLLPSELSQNKFSLRVLSAGCVRVNEPPWLSVLDDESSTYSFSFGSRLSDRRWNIRGSAFRDETKFSASYSNAELDSIVPVMSRADPLCSSGVSSSASLEPATAPPLILDPECDTFWTCSDCESAISPLSSGTRRPDGARRGKCGRPQPFLVISVFHAFNLILFVKDESRKFKYSYSTSYRVPGKFIIICFSFRSAMSSSGSTYSCT